MLEMHSALNQCLLLGVQLRHPNILSFISSGETEKDEGGTAKPSLYIVSEPVMPLADKIRELNLEGSQKYVPFVLCKGAGMTALLMTGLDKKQSALLANCCAAAMGLNTNV